MGQAKTKTTIVNCLNRADVTAASSAAGVVGMAGGIVNNAAAAKNAPVITGCGNTGTITATDAAGCAGGGFRTGGSYRDAAAEGRGRYAAGDGFLTDTFCGQ